jgi:hypothetical protein
MRSQQGLQRVDLTVAAKKRPSIKFPSGTFQSERNYIDFIVDGESLTEFARRVGYDLVSVLTREGLRKEVQRSHKRLMLEEAADFPNNRRSILVCGECGDLGCGALSVVIDSFGDSVTWSNFGYENTYEEQVRLEKLESLGPFRFDLTKYRSALDGALTLLEKA